MKRRLPSTVLAFLVFSGLARWASAAPFPTRPPSWAEAVSGTRVPNLYRIEPDLLRSAQPGSAGFQDIAALGVKTVLDLRAGHADAEEAGKTALRLLNVPMTAWSFRDDRVLEALRIVADPKNRPLLIHCQKGADRTGAILALYRVVVQGWTKQDALREMNEGGYHHSSLFRNLDRYVLNADIDALKKALAGPIAAVQPAPAAKRPDALSPANFLLHGPMFLPAASPEPTF